MAIGAQRDSRICASTTCVIDAPNSSIVVHAPEKYAATALHLYWQP